MRLQGVPLRVPHDKTGAKGMAQNHHWSISSSREFVIYLNAISFDDH
jgi:hypothetical protein